jgi:dihydrofolate reductase
VRRTVFAINITADGYCGHTDGIADEELHDYFTDIILDAGCIIYGRKTYELMVPYWPDVAKHSSGSRATLAFARAFGAVEKIVFSTTLTGTGDGHSRLLHSNLEERVRALQQESGKKICVGSLSIASQLSLAGLIDEYHFVVHPILAGKGPRLFETVLLPKRQLLEFVESRRFGSGAIAQHYTRPSRAS